MINRTKIFYNCSSAPVRWLLSLLPAAAVPPALRPLPPPFPPLLPPPPLPAPPHPLLWTMLPRTALMHWTAVLETLLAANPISNQFEIAAMNIEYDFGLKAEDVVSYKGVKSNDNGDAGLVLVVEAAAGKAQDVVNQLTAYKQDQVAFYGNYAEFASGAGVTWRKRCHRLQGTTHCHGDRIQRVHRQIWTVPWTAP